MTLAPTISAAHHPGGDDGLDVRTIVMWVGAAVAAGAIVLLRWVTSRRRRRDDVADDDADG